MPHSSARSRSALTLALFGSLTGLGCQHTSSGPDAGSSDTDKGEPRMCTSMGCADLAEITTQLTAAGGALGSHAFAIEVDGEAKTCTVEFTSETEAAYGKCSDGVELRFGPAMQGREMTMDGAVGYTEDPIPGQFQWQLSFHGQPAKVHVVHTHADQTIVDASAAFVYTEHRPNGAGCEPVCKSAAIEWTGP
ncbi:hypothetical protein [Enhygromyxa salina]|nr:hypothetical protein [Enhygromyxa salina]